MTNVKNYQKNSKNSFFESLKRLLRLDVMQIFFVVIICCALIFVISLFWFARDTQVISVTIAEKWNQLFKYFEFYRQFNDFVSKNIGFVIWFILGMIIFIIASTLMDIMKSNITTIKVSKNYIHPTSFDQKKYWFSYLARIFTKILASVILTVLITYVFVQILKFTIFVIYNMWQPFSLLQATANTLTVMGLWIMYFWMVIVFTRLIALRAPKN